MRLSLKSLVSFFEAEKTVYSHRNRSIDVIALEKGMDIDIVKQAARVIMKSEGRPEAVIYIRKSFHVPLSTAWVFVDTLK